MKRTGVGLEYPCGDARPCQVSTFKGRQFYSDHEVDPSGDMNVGKSSSGKRAHIGQLWMDDDVYGFP
jgi:hypothetical protein